MEKRRNVFIPFIVKYPSLVIASTLFLVVISLFFLPHIKLASSVDVFFDRESPSYVKFQEWKRQFGSDEIVIVALYDNDIFTEENLRLIDNLTSRFLSLPYVDKVTSITNVNDINGYNDIFVVKKFMEEIPSQREKLEKLKRRAISNPLYVKNLISKDATTAAIMIQLEDKENSGSYAKEVVDNVRKILNELVKDKKYYLSGSSAIEYFFTLYMQDDLKRFLPLILLIIFVILLLSLGDIKMVCLPFVTITVSLIFTMWFLYLCGFAINNVTTIIPPIILAISVCDSIHLLTESLQKKGESTRSSEEDFLKRISDLFFPCFLTSLTTAIGFFSLTVSKVSPVRELGLVAGVGVFFAFVVTFTFLPALVKKFALLNKYNSIFRKKESLFFKDKIDSFLIKIGRFNENFSIPILIFTIILVSLSLWGVRKIKVETNILEFFAKSTPIYKATTFIDKKLGGVYSLNISLKADKEDYFKDPVSLKRLERLQEFLSSIPEVNKITSVLDYIKEINKSFHNEDEKFYKIPSSRKLIAQYILLYGTDDMDDFIDSKWQWTTIRACLKEYSTHRLEKVIETIQNYLDKNYNNSSVKGEVLGYVVLDVEANKTVTEGQIKSLGLAMLVIFGMMFFVFRAVSVGVISIIPNLLPILVNFGIMGWLGIRLDSATSMISAIGIGVIVDDTIHFLHEFSKFLKKDRDYVKAMYYTISHKGRPIILTSVILFFGFGIVSISRFIPTSSFGVLTALLMANALLGDLVILPCILMFLKPKFK
ncbi:MAG: hypothetical protein B6D55_04090 [Candidatus Omnitrophica bacterium 4484_70.2]|nr:MAG: hypothetical protein B6D55_04090 [Candidatus Omnitrophica bacterium 4484_70.2]